MLRPENGVYLLDVSIAPPKWKPEQGISRKAIESLASMTRGGETEIATGNVEKIVAEEVRKVARLLAGREGSA